MLVTPPIDAGHVCPRVGRNLHRHLYAAIAAWLDALGRSKVVDEASVRFVRYRNMPSFGPAPRRAWISEYVDTVSVGADPDALMCYVDIGGEARDLGAEYVGWFETPEELALHHLRRLGVGAVVNELRPFFDLAAYGRHLLSTPFSEVHGHVFSREP